MGTLNLPISLWQRMAACCLPILVLLAATTTANNPSLVSVGGRRNTLHLNNPWECCEVQVISTRWVYSYFAFSPASLPLAVRHLLKFYSSTCASRPPRPA